jgi:hypothetical protein
MAEQVHYGLGESARTPLAVNSPVLVFPGTAQEQGGVIVEDFGANAGQAVDVGANRIVGPARRWAVRLNDGNLVFVDDHQLSPL